jgi:tetratricopeptide (TPR) repeat protein
MQEDVAFIQSRQPLQTRIDQYQGARDYAAAIRACYQLLRREHNQREYRSRLAGLYLVRATARLGNGNQSRQIENDLRHLQRAIAVCEALRRQDPDIATIYEVIGRLYRLLSMRLADAGPVDPARAASRRARLYFPDPSDDTLALSQLSDDEERALVAQRLRAIQRSLWLDIGLAIPENGWDNQAALLSRVITATIAVLSTGRAGLVETWDHYASCYPALARLDRERVLRFLHETLFNSTYIHRRWFGTNARVIGE